MGDALASHERNVILARFLRSQIAAAARPPVGCVQINNEEAELCALALERSSPETQAMTEVISREAPPPSDFSPGAS